MGLKENPLVLFGSESWMWSEVSNKLLPSNIRTGIGAYTCIDCVSLSFSCNYIQTLFYYQGKQRFSWPVVRLRME